MDEELTKLCRKAAAHAGAFLRLRSITPYSPLSDHEWSAILARAPRRLGRITESLLEDTAGQDFPHIQEQA